MIHIDRRKCVLFVNDKTLFNFIVPDLSRAQIRDLEKLFKSYLSCVLADAGIAEADRGRILSEYDDVGFANTSSKSVLGSMNDLAFHYTYSIQEAGGVHRPAVPEIKSYSMVMFTRKVHRKLGGNFILSMRCGYTDDPLLGEPVTIEQIRETLGRVITLVPGPGGGEPAVTWTTTPASDVVAVLPK